MNFHEISYLSIFRKFVEKNQISLKSDKKDGYFTWWCKYIYDYLAQFLFEKYF